MCRGVLCGQMCRGVLPGRFLAGRCVGQIELDATSQNGQMDPTMDLCVPICTILLYKLDMRFDPHDASSNDMKGSKYHNFGKCTDKI